VQKIGQTRPATIPDLASMISGGVCEGVRQAPPCAGAHAGRPLGGLQVAARHVVGDAAEIVGVDTRFERPESRFWTKFYKVAVG